MLYFYIKYRFTLSLLKISVSSQIFPYIHYMHNGLSIYQTKYCKTTFFAFPRLASFNIQSSSGGQNKNYYVRSHNKSFIMSELQINLQKHNNICCCSFM